MGEKHYKGELPMKANADLVEVTCKRCGKRITTRLPIVSDKQCICANCLTLDEEYQILEEQAKLKGFK